MYSRNPTRFRVLLINIVKKLCKLIVNCLLFHIIFVYIINPTRFRVNVINPTRFRVNVNNFLAGWSWPFNARFGM
jgi:hypothetical protein